MKDRLQELVLLHAMGDDFSAFSIQEGGQLGASRKELPDSQSWQCCLLLDLLLADYNRKGLGLEAVLLKVTEI